MAEGQGFEPWVGYKPTPVFKTGALNHSATLPLRRKLYIGFSDQQYAFIKKTYINDVFLKIIISENKNRARCSVFIHHLMNFTIIHLLHSQLVAHVLPRADHSQGE